MGMSLLEMRKAIELARELGVTSMRVDGLGLTVTLGPAPGTARTGPLPESVGAPTCKCGHPLYIHAGGICKECGADKRCLGAAKVR